jgi:hypothetical protein
VAQVQARDQPRPIEALAIAGLRVFIKEIAPDASGGTHALHDLKRDPAGQQQIAGACQASGARGNAAT